ncbi:MAG: hypothetical protein VX733_09290 [Candidatus Latescibacterota bacterium]|nr:hypothetical protein [Candidatus Latescibacterota bacterium]
MFRVIAACAVLALGLTSTLAKGEVRSREGEHPPGIFLGPPKDFEPPESMEPPQSPEEARKMFIHMMFGAMDTNGDRSIDPDEFMPWVRHVEMPSPPPHIEDMHPSKGGDMGMMDGILRRDPEMGELPIAPECSDEFVESEMDPQAEGVPCRDRAGNLVFRTICNMPGYDMQAISLPDGRAAACFGIEALRGEIGFMIETEGGEHIWDTTMGKESYMRLKLDGPGVFHVKSTGGSPDGAVSVKFVDAPADM